MQPLSLNVFFIEQTAQASTCQTFHRLGVAQVRQPRQEVAHLAAACEAFRPSCRQLHKSVLEDFKMSLETILIIVLIVFLLGGGGWYWGRGRG